MVGKLQSLDRVYGVVHTMSSAYRLLSAQHHFRVVDIICMIGLSGCTSKGFDIERVYQFVEIQSLSALYLVCCLFDSYISESDAELIPESRLFTIMK